MKTKNVPTTIQTAQKTQGGTAPWDGWKLLGFFKNSSGVMGIGKNNGKDELTNTIKQVFENKHISDETVEYYMTVNFNNDYSKLRNTIVLPPFDKKKILFWNGNFNKFNTTDPINKYILLAVTTEMNKDGYFSLQDTKFNIFKYNKEYYICFLEQTKDVVCGVKIHKFSYYKLTIREDEIISADIIDSEIYCTLAAFKYFNSLIYESGKSQANKKNDIYLLNENLKQLDTNWNKDLQTGKYQHNWTNKDDVNLSINNTKDNTVTIISNLLKISNNNGYKITLLKSNTDTDILSEFYKNNNYIILNEILKTGKGIESINLSNNENINEIFNNCIPINIIKTYDDYIIIIFNVKDVKDVKDVNYIYMIVPNPIIHYTPKKA